MEKSGNFWYGLGRKTAAAALAGGLALGLAGCEPISDESKIVTGVPGQVENHSAGKHCRSMLRGMCLKWIPDYYLGIEQCPVDIQNAQRGEQTTSFDPRVGEVYSSCNYDTVRVDAAAYSDPQYADGATIMFPGPVGQTLHK